MKTAWATLGVLLVLAIGGLLVATALGYAPGISRLTGIGQPRDLGVDYTDADVISAQDKLDDTLGSEPVLKTFSDAELTALLNTCPTNTCAVHDVQVRILTDGKFEFSGLVEKSKIESFIDLVELTETEQVQIRTALGLLPTQPSFYAKAQMNGHDDVVTFALDEAIVASLPVPENLMAEINEEVMNSLNAYLLDLPGTQIKSIEVTPEGVVVEGSF